MVGWNKNRLFRPKSMLPDAVRGKRSVLMALFNHLGDFGRTFQKGTSSSIEAPFRA